MGNKRISELQIEVNPQISDLVALASNGQSKRTTLGSIVNATLPATFGNTTIDGDLIVNGNLNISTIISSSILYDSGSTIFGNSIDDTHNFIGDVSITGSLLVSGETEFGGDIYPKIPRGSSLGTSDNPFSSLFVSSGSVYIESDIPGDSPGIITNVGGDISIDSAGFRLVSGSTTPFRLFKEGIITIRTGYQDPTSRPLFEIIGNIEGSASLAVNTGTMLQTTAYQGQSNRSIFDSYGSSTFSQLNLRKANGSVFNPTTTGEGVIGRIGSSGWLDGIDFGIPGVTALPAYIDFYTNGYRSGSRETMIRFYATSDNELDPINYSTVIKADGLEVTGSVDITGDYTINGNSFSSSLYQSSSISGSVIEFTKGDTTTQQVQIPKGLGYSGLGWARYGDTTYTTSSAFTIVDGADIKIPCNGSGSIETHMHSPIPFFNPTAQRIQAENAGDVYVITLNFSMRAVTLAADGDFVRLTMNNTVGTPYTRVGRDLFFAKKDTNWHKFHEVFQYYSDTDFVTNGNEFNIIPNGINVQIADVILFIQRTQNHSQH